MNRLAHSLHPRSRLFHSTLAWFFGLPPLVLAPFAAEGCSARHDTAAEDFGTATNATNPAASFGMQPPDAFVNAPYGGPAPQLPGDIKMDFATFMAAAVAAKPAILQRQQRLLAGRYDLTDRPSATAKMFRGKAIQEGVRVRLAEGLTWDALASMTPESIRAADLFPGGFYPLPHPLHEVGGMVLPKTSIDEIRRQTGRDLLRFDVEFDLPEAFLPEFPPPMFLTSRKDLGDVTQGQLVTTQNFYDLFQGILNPKDLGGLRLLVTPFAQQQFNLTDDRRAATPQLGIACFDCHVNGHTNGATHLVGEVRPESHRRRTDTPSLRGVSIQRLFGSQRALKSVEDFTQFEQEGAYFDSDELSAIKKGINVLDRETQINGMAELQELLDFPPASHLDPITGRLDRELASAAETRGEDLFFGKAQCASCHAPPYYTDNLEHDLALERFYVTPRTVNGMDVQGEGLIKTMVLRGIKDTPPYLHDGRLLTLDDTIEFFNVVTRVHLNADQKSDLRAFLLAL
jgi:cytochrome c peroxidase